MLDVISTTSVVFLLIAAGFVAVKRSVFSSAELATLGKYVISFALPALIIQSVSTREFGEIVDLAYLGAYGLGSVAAFAAGYLVSRRVLGLDPLACTFQGMGTSCANSGFIGYPILLIAMPSIAATAFALNVVVENVLMIPLVLALAEKTANGVEEGRSLGLTIAGRVLRNPMVLALIVALAIALSGVELPEVVMRPFSLVAASSVAVSLIVIGGTLAGLSLNGLDGRVFVVVLGKLALHPLAVWLAFVGLGILGLRVADATLSHAAVLLAASPSMTIYPILAQRYGQQNSAALAMLLMTGASFFTISAVLWLVTAGP
ncbi:AEC family transporter [Consotaella aegiceratis]|uniref:AEC family transporter n=1 Tax=Consotaella aegiceratis TaxID=3097961 RepID=UPI002F42A841